MKKLTETQKSIIKWAFVLVLLGLIVYVFRDMAGPIAKQLVKTSPWIVVLILVATLLYGVFESTITMLFARQYNPTFTFRQDIFCVILQNGDAWKRSGCVGSGLPE